jgi:hypothetical protein
MWHVTFTHPKGFWTGKVMASSRNEAIQAAKAKWGSNIKVISAVFVGNG